MVLNNSPIYRAFPFPQDIMKIPRLQFNWVRPTSGRGGQRPANYILQLQSAYYFAHYLGVQFGVLLWGHCKAARRLMGYGNRRKHSHLENRERGVVF
jgi:hypothetical protein